MKLFDIELLINWFLQISFVAMLGSCERKQLWSGRGYRTNRNTFSKEYCSVIGSI